MDHHLPSIRYRLLVTSHNAFLHSFRFAASFRVLSRLSPNFSVISSSHLLLGLPLLFFPSTCPCIITFSKLLPVLKMYLQYFSLPRSMTLSSNMWGCIFLKTQSFVFWQSMEFLVAVYKSTFRMRLMENSL